MGRANGNKRGGGKVSKRTQTVWASLVGSMTLVMGALFVLAPKNAAHAGGMSLTPLMATAEGGSLEAVVGASASPAAGRWKYIVVDATGTSFGTARDIDARAREGGLSSMGHHFVIGNGNGMADGEVTIGARWVNQQPGAHTPGQTDQARALNVGGIGIALVGNGDKHAFTPAQMSRLHQLIGTLQRECGIPASRVYLQQDVSAGKRPGVLFPAAEFRQRYSGR